MNLVTHLLIHHASVPAGREWSGNHPGWKIARVASGFFYWLSANRSPARELNAGDVIVIGPRTEGVLRASLIAEASLDFIIFCPEQLVGLMSLTERLTLETAAADHYVRIVPVADSIAKAFSDVASDSTLPAGFVHRCRILNIVGAIFGDLLPAARAAQAHLVTTQLRFEQMIERLPDSDLMNYPSERLAELCGCSTRHLRRMFRKHFKTSIRAKQTELRLEKARQLLAETDEKIITVALESGYRHLGFFNSMFKKKFGVTPSEWRKSNVSPARHAVHASAAALLILPLLKLLTNPLV